MREKATEPEDLGRLLLERLNAGDADGLAALYEAEATLALPGGQVVTGRDEIRRTYEKIVEGRPTFSPGEQRPARRSGDLALTSTLLPGSGVTAEVARRQPDGTWLWVIDDPNLLG